MRKILYSLLAVLVLLALVLGFVRFLCFFYPVSYKSSVIQHSRTYGVDEHLVYAVIRAESKFNPDAVSDKGAVGLMQIMEPTGEWVAEKIELENPDLKNPDTNIEIGTFYLSYLLDLYRGDTVCALAAYNAGQSTVNGWLSDKKISKNGKTLGSIPYPETRQYVEKVMKNLKWYENLY